MSDFYWFGVPVILAPFLCSWVVYFLLQGPKNGGNFDFFGRLYFTNMPLDLIRSNFSKVSGLECLAKGSFDTKFVRHDE